MKVVILKVKIFGSWEEQYFQVDHGKYSTPKCDHGKYSTSISDHGKYSTSATFALDRAALARKITGLFNTDCAHHINDIYQHL